MAASDLNAYGDHLVWSHRAAPRRFQLVVYANGRAQRLAIPSSRQQLDADLGPGPDGAPVIVYRSCRPNCRVYQYSVATGRETRVPIPLPLACDPDWPAVWGGAIVFSVGGRGCRHTSGVWVFGGTRARLVARSYAGPMDLRSDQVTWTDYGDVVTRVKLTRLARGSPVVTLFADAERCCRTSVIISSPTFGPDGIYWGDWNESESLDHHRLYRAPGVSKGACEASTVELPSGVRSLNGWFPWIDFTLVGRRVAYVIPGGIYEHATTAFDSRYSKYVAASPTGPYCGP
jgi:hypothetical protein